MNELVNSFFRWCVEVLVWIGNVTGMGYELANIVIFVILQPLLILIFLILWLRERKKNKNNTDHQEELVDHDF